MPFLKRKTSPVKIRCHRDNFDHVFEEHVDVINNAMVGALLQLSSITFHAEDIFRELEEELRSVCRRCHQARDKLEQLDERTRNLNHRDVPIPMSDLSTEGKIPLHFHYKSPVSVEDNFFTVDSRSPCIIHLHTLASSDANDVSQVSQAYHFEPTRNSFKQEDITQKNPQSTDGPMTHRSSSLTNPPEPEKFAPPQSSLPTPDERMKIQSAQHKAEIVTVDTSGSQFERRVILRRSQRSSVSSVRRKSQLKYRSRLHTMSAFSPHNGNQYDVRSLNGIQRPYSALSDRNSNSSCLGDVSVCNSEPCRGKQNAEIQTDEVQILPPTKPRRNVKHRYSMPLPVRNPNTAHNRTHVPVESSNANNCNHWEASARGNAVSEVREKTEGARKTNTISLCNEDRTSNNEEILPNERLYSSQTDDRISSGFWSGSESCRHSTTSEILLQHHNVTQALQQILAKHPPPAKKSVPKDTDGSSNVSTMSVNSHLSTFCQSPKSSSFLSLDFSAPTECHNISPNVDSVFVSSSGSPVRNFDSIPPGGYSYMNPAYMEYISRDSYLPSPMNLMDRDDRPHCSRTVTNGFKSPSSVDNIKMKNTHLDGNLTKRQPNAIQRLPYTTGSPPFLSNDPATPSVGQLTSTPDRMQFIGPNLQLNSADAKPMQPEPKASKYVSNDLQSELKSHLQTQQQQQQSVQNKPASKPALPRRSSSLKSSRNLDKSAARLTPVATSQKPSKEKTSPEPSGYRGENHYQTPRSPPARKCGDGSSSFVLLENQSVVGKAKPVPELYQKPIFSNSNPVTSPVYDQNTGDNTLTHLNQSASEVKVTAPATSGCQSATAVKSLPSHMSPLLPTLSNSTQRSAQPVNGHTPQSSTPVGRKASASNCTETKVVPKVIDRPPTPKRHSPDSAALLSQSQMLTRVDILATQTPKQAPDTLVPVDVSSVPSTSSNDAASLSSMTSSDMMSSPELSKVTSSRISCSNSSPTTSSSTLVSVSQDVGSLPNETQSNEALTAAENVAIDTTVTSVVSGSIVSSPKESSLRMTSSADLPQIVTTPSRVAKPVVRPRPFPFSSSRSQKNKPQDQGTKQENIKRRTASARAAFFGVSTPTSVTEEKAVVGLQRSVQEKENNVEKAAVDKVITHQDSLKLTAKKRDPKHIGNNEEKSSSLNFSETSHTNGDQVVFEETDIDEVEPQPVTTRSEIIIDKKTVENDQTIRSNIKLKPAASLENKPTDANGQINVKYNGEHIMNDKGIEVTKNGNELCNSSDDFQVTSANSSPKSVPLNKPTRANVPSIKPTRASVTLLLKLEEANIDSASVNSSTPVSSTRAPSFPKLSNGIASPISSHCSSPTLNGSSYASGLDSSNVRPAASASRADFKAMLLQNFSRSSNGPNISAAEKLQRTTQSGAQDMNNGVAVRQRIVSAGDIRAVLGASRSSKRPSHSFDHRRSFADSSISSNKKHQSLYISGRRHSSRNRPPTRPMLSISEDGETDDLSAGKTYDEKQRSISVTDL